MTLKVGGLIVSESVAVVETDAPSVTLTVKLFGPAAVGVPDIVPPEARVKPEGSDPFDTDHEYGGDPPAAPSACEYATPITPAGSDEMVILNAAGLIVSDRAAVTETDARSTARTVKLLDPVAPGVPEIVPSAERLNPVGNDPLVTDHEYGGSPPEAPSNCE